MSLATTPNPTPSPRPLAAARPVPAQASRDRAQQRCPKRMAFGPCAGVVSAAGDCEVPGHGRCDFLDLPARRWPGPQLPGVAPPLPAARAVLTDFPSGGPSTGAALSAVARELQGCTDAVLLGDHGGARVQLPPAFRARLLIDAGLPVWAGLHCRDRNRVALEAEVAALATLPVAAPGVAGLVATHCVTGDHTSRGDRADAQPVFDLDATELANLVAGAGLSVSVAAAPCAAPVERRAARTAAKVRAGAGVVVVDHTDGPATVARFVQAVRAEGVDPVFLACVPVVVDAGSAAVLESFPGLTLPVGYLRSVGEAPDPRVAGIRAAVELAEGLLAVPGIRGVNLSGGAQPGRELELAQALAEVGNRLRSSTRLPGARC